MKDSNSDSRRGHVSPELYEELLNRYERALVFAGQLQEQARQGKLLSERNNLLAERNTSLEDDNETLEKLLGVEKKYVVVLENALRSIGVLESPEGLEA